VENYALIFPSIQWAICYHGKLIANQSNLLEFWENGRQFLIMDKKIPLSTNEAGFINCADSFSIPIQGLKGRMLNLCISKTRLM
jgi:hypothetical protein